MNAETQLRITRTDNKRLILEFGKELNNSPCHTTDAALQFLMPRVLVVLVVQVDDTWPTAAASFCTVYT